MADLNTAESGILLASYTAQTQSLTAARRLANLVVSAALPGQSVNTGPGPSTSIILSLTRSDTPSTALVTPVSYGGPGTPPISQTPGPVTNQVAFIRMDVSPDGGNGYAQSVRYTVRARQSIHQTPSGFIVDEFGFAPGSLTVEAIISAADGVLSNLALFRNLLVQAKLASPLSPNPASTLTYINSIDGTKMLLTQTQLDFSQDATMPNQARVTITADVLRDFGSQSSASPAPSTQTPATQQAALLSYTDGITTATGGLGNIS
jgi:hypothetical protein